MNRIRELRTGKNMGQAELAKLLKVSQGTLSNWERGVHEPDHESLERLADIFQTSYDYILGREIRMNLQNFSDPQPKHSLPLDDEVVEMMREMHERPELRVLFKTSKKVKAEDLKAVNELLKRMVGEDDNEPR